MVGALVAALATTGLVLLLPARRPSPALVRGIAVSLASGAAAAGLMWMVAGVPALCSVAGAAGSAAPIALARRRARADRVAIAAAWPDAVDIIRSAIRAGVAVPAAVGEPARRGPKVLRPRFTEYRRRLAAGEPFEQALTTLDEDGAAVVAGLGSSLRLAVRVGAADIGAVLSALSEFQRADVAQRLEVEARHSWNVAAARLAVAAPWLTVLALSMQPEARSAYSSPAGTLVLAGVLVLSVLAYAVMQRIARSSAAGAGW